MTDTQNSKVHKKLLIGEDSDAVTEAGLKLLAMSGLALAKAVDCQYLTMESTALTPGIIERTVKLTEVVGKVIALAGAPTECTAERLDPLWEFLVSYLDFCDEHPAGQERHYVQ